MSTAARSVDEVAQIWDATNHYGPVFIASLSIQIRRAGVQKKFAGRAGSVDREQGVSKAGNPRLRTTLIQLAWLWLRNQPQSALALWFKDRVSRNGGRLKKTTIVALARKLLVTLWKYVTAGVVVGGPL